MTTGAWIDELEDELRATATALTAPGRRECLACYVARMLAEFGCDTSLRWAVHFRDVRVPRAVALERRLGERGAFCDCEIFFNTTELHPRFAPPAGDAGADWVPPACPGVRGGTVLPCGVWLRRRRW